jgi:hypothetical protein
MQPEKKLAACIYDRTNLVHVLGQILERVQTLRDEVQPFILHIPSEF